MTRAAALHAFFNGFTIPAYVSSAVPDNAEFPYMTYTYGVNGFNMGSYSSTVNIYYYTDSESLPNQKAGELFAAIGIGGTIISSDEGAIWIKPGTPWCQSVVDDVNSSVKRRYINVELEFL